MGWFDDLGNVPIIKEAKEGVQSLGKGVAEAWTNARGSADAALREGGWAGGGANKGGPAAAPLPVMPTVDSEAVRLARRRALLNMRNRGGRQSTILTGDTLGG